MTRPADNVSGLVLVGDIGTHRQLNFAAIRRDERVYSAYSLGPIARTPRAIRAAIEHFVASPPELLMMSITCLLHGIDVGIKCGLALSHGLLLRLERLLLLGDHRIRTLLNLRRSVENAGGKMTVTCDPGVTVSLTL